MTAAHQMQKSGQGKGNVFKKIKIDMHFIVWKYGEDVHTPEGEFRVDVVIRKSSQWKKKKTIFQEK